MQEDQKRGSTSGPFIQKAAILSVGGYFFACSKGRFRAIFFRFWRETVCLAIPGMIRKNGSAIKQKRGTIAPLFGDQAGIRTQDPQLRRLLLYPTELPDRFFSWGKGIIII